MDIPLLALTRRRTGPAANLPETILSDNMRQLIQLRWLAVVGQLVTIVAVGAGLRAPLPIAALLTVVAVLAIVNLTVGHLLRRRPLFDEAIFLALLFDVGALSVQLYLTGGADNPFISLYLVQVVLGAILLPRPFAWALVLVTSCAFVLLAYDNVPLRLPTALPLGGADLYKIGAGVSFALVAALLVLFIARISRNLRTRDAYLADMRQRAVEEDHIVRMGLFASGAAHELGTPLASLSVILGDWRRMPKLTGDPDLIEEIEVMQAEVQRCKSIVTDVLHSAGQPRSEAIEKVDVVAFMVPLLEAWREIRPDLRTTYQNRAGDVAVAADPALRQAIWNLLENAAEASPGGIELTLACVDEMLAIVVGDHGPGFTPALLETLGEPKASSKGEGHGVGLFLAANVARRLGGRLEAANLARGGAEVRLLIPRALTPSRRG